ncbi:thymidylate kinase [Candidatus Curtissbacteria bacterium]|nr:thymidylate kinase [Candidatus Curtissbacteria bacterium]
MIKGKLIVFEGADGSGKTTQAKLLLKFLQKGKIDSKYISFPRYKDSRWGQMVGRYLAGDFGKVGDVDPYLASLSYAGDRASAASMIKKWLAAGKMVIVNRYIGSNMAHMAAKIKDEGSRIKYIKWLEKLEYEENGIPGEDLVIFLHVPVDISRKLIKDRKLDIHEEDLEYLAKVVKVYDFICGLKKYWQKVECTKGGKILPAEGIHQKVLEVLKNKNILRTK